MSIGAIILILLVLILLGGLGGIGGAILWHRLLRWRRLGSHNRNFVDLGAHGPNVRISVGEIVKEFIQSRGARSG
jgi:hypothetical protein